MPAIADEDNKQVEGFSGQGNRSAIPEQLALTWKKLEIAKSKDGLFLGGHGEDLGNLQEEFRRIARTVCRCLSNYPTTRQETVGGCPAPQPRKYNMWAWCSGMGLQHPSTPMLGFCGCFSLTRERTMIRVAKNEAMGILLVALGLLFTASARSAPEDEVRATFDRFVAAQNAHDVKAVEALLADTPGFLWITGGTPVWGREAALKRFATLYEGTWRLDPELSGMKVIAIDENVAQIYVPISFMIGPTGQPPKLTRFFMNQVLIKDKDGWRISSILPIPAPAP